MRCLRGSHVEGNAYTRAQDHRTAFFFIINFRCYFIQPYISTTKIWTPAITTPLEHVFIVTQPFLTFLPPVDGHRNTEDILVTPICTVPMLLCLLHYNPKIEALGAIY